jgi:hypothetical protein
MAMGLREKVKRDLAGYLSRRLAQAEEVNAKWSSIALCRATCEHLNKEMEDLQKNCPHLVTKGMETEPGGPVQYHCESCKAEVVE